jgi:hypothetical protein
MKITFYIAPFISKTIAALERGITQEINYFDSTLNKK